MHHQLLCITAQKMKEVVCCKRLTEQERTEQQKAEMFEYVKEKQTQKKADADERIQTITEACERLKKKQEEDNKKNLEELQKSIGQLAILQVSVLRYRYVRNAHLLSDVAWLPRLC